MVFDYLKVYLVVGMTGSVSVNENGDRNEDYAVYDFHSNGTRGKFVEVGRYYGFEHEYVQTGKVNKALLQIINCFY